MLKILITSFISLATCHFIHAQNLQAYLMYARFLSPKHGAFVETYLSITGNSVVHVKNLNGSFQGTVEVVMIFTQNDSIRYYDKYDLAGPEITDTAAININFIDQQRVLLPDGVYDFQIEITDKNNPGQSFKHNEAILMDISENTVSISDLEFIDTLLKSTETTMFTKNGYSIVPFVSNFYPAGFNNLSFYAEIYNTGKISGNDEKYLLSYYIETFAPKAMLNQYIRHKRETTGDVNVLFGGFSIEMLPTGNYNLVIEARDKNNNLLAERRFFFQRSNPDGIFSIDDINSVFTSGSFASKILNMDTLAENIRSLRPVSGQNELHFIDNQLAGADLEIAQKFFYHFWQKRNNTDPNAAWMLYKHEVDKVNKTFGTKIDKGYETDRGRVYLHYGQPSIMAKYDHEPSSYPYEIWHYHFAENQTNVKFVFMDNEYATNNYELIHSTAIGEVNDRRWHLRLMKRNTILESTDQEISGEHYGGRALEYFQNPR